jgi:hypothetical protein
VIELRLASLGHGVVTLDKPGCDPNAAENLQLVLACGEDPVPSRTTCCARSSAAAAGLMPNYSRR